MDRSSPYGEANRNRRGTPTSVFERIGKLGFYWQSGYARQGSSADEVLDADGDDKELWVVRSSGIARER
jgi:hypothetical protein